MMFKLKRVRVVLMDDGRIDSLVAVDVVGARGRTILTVPNLRRAVWDEARWLSMKDLSRKARGPVRNEEEVLAALTSDAFGPLGTFGGFTTPRRVDGFRRAAAVLERAGRERVARG